MYLRLKASDIVKFFELALGDKIPMVSYAATFFVWTLTKHLCEMLVVMM